MIRAADGSGWIPVTQDRLRNVLLPERSDATVVDGWGEVRFALAGMEFSVSGEEVGWQITVEGSIDSSVADAAVAQVTYQLIQASGQEATWVVITEG